MIALRTSPAGFPMAPSAEEWDALSPDERAAVLDALPGEVTYDEMAMPEGDLHFRAKDRALETLCRHFRRLQRRIYVGVEMPTYYPAEPRFAPDLIAVLGADAVERDKWIVSAEGKGLDWVLEIHAGGDRKRDAELNIARYARLASSEYFIYDCAQNRLEAYRLDPPDARVYTAIVPNHGLYESRVLDLDICVDDDRLRFYTRGERLLGSEELVARLQEMYDDAQRRAEEEARRREEAERLREEETRLREEAEQEVARLRAELERLKR